MNESYKYGVYYDIDTSTIFYEYKDLKFYFSSELLKKAFLDKLKNLDIDKRIFEQKYYCRISDTLFLVFKYYKKVEKRGFRVEDNNNERINTTRVLLEF